MVDTMVYAEAGDDAAAPPRRKRIKETAPVQFHTVHYSVYPAPIVPPSHSSDPNMPTTLHSTVVTGNALDVLATLSAGSSQTVVTSPPYWSLRDYSIPSQIGLEDDPNDYIASLVTVFDEVRRVLTDDGALWLNMGDSYTSGRRTWRAPDKKHPIRAMATRPPTPQGLKPKELVGIPWRLAFALQAAGWYLQSMKGIDRQRIGSETPSSTDIFDAADIRKRTGSDWDNLKWKLGAVIGAPLT